MLCSVAMDKDLPYTPFWDQLCGSVLLDSIRLWLDERNFFDSGSAKKIALSVWQEKTAEWTNGNRNSWGATEGRAAPSCGGDESGERTMILPNKTH